MNGSPDVNMTPYPLRFRPLIKRAIWGGRRLGQQLGKPIGNDSDYAESWEVVDHGLDQSVVESGPLAGQTLSQLVDNHRDWLLGAGATATKFPLLLKYLDCNRVLSVQVHPDDAYALAMDKPDLGKTEAWYVVASQPDSLIYAGLKAGVDRVQLGQAVAAGEVERLLHSFHPAPGDVIFIPAGTVHALGAGLLIAEIQQASDTTFRLFDWNRLGTDGTPRPLHVQASLDVTDYAIGPIHPKHIDASTVGWQELVRCDKFVLEAIAQGGGSVGGDDQFHILTVPHGASQLNTEFESLRLEAGQSVLLPASHRSCRVEVGPGSVMLRMRLPDSLASSRQPERS